VTIPPGYPDRVPTPRPPQSPQEPPPGGYRLPTPAEVCRALLRRHAARALARSSTALRGTADALTRTRWRLEDTARNRAVGLSVVPGGYAQGRADLALTHGAPQLSDGYLADAETWQPGHGPVPDPVVALMRIDRVLGNEGALSDTGVGRIRGLTLRALNDWYRHQPTPRKDTHRYPDRKAEADEFWRQVDAGLIPRPPRTVHRPEGV
jgi:hypothetical protein